ncbi:phosphotransferase [Phenylobacterium sp.]|uniref:phosphotransferase enzyme family protein n=1 Tax=Phenylobacterium sp. TaxID=1871053 RepID=UPI00289C51B3|nr:phosphotransferase [Phenylobacterium sp.]
MSRSGTEARFLPAALHALKAFGVDARTVALAWHGENLTFRAEDFQGTVYALRLHRSGHNSREELEAEFVWVQALADAGVSVPDRRLTCDGGAVAAIRTETGEERFASLARWVNGMSLHQMLETCPEQLVQGAHLAKLGAATARMHAQAKAWRPPPGFVRRALNFETLIGDAPVWGHFDRHPALTRDERAVLTQARDDLRERLAGQTAASSLIHGDLTLANVMADGDGLRLIDFDDAGFGSPLYDLGTLLFHLVGEADYRRCEATFLEAYAAIEPLADDSLALLSPMMLMRGLFLVGWFEQRPKLSASRAFVALKAAVVSQARAFLDG